MLEIPETLRPGEAKLEFSKRLEAIQNPERKIVLETSDKMTNQQIAAKIRRYFPG